MGDASQCVQEGVVGNGEEQQSRIGQQHQAKGESQPAVLREAVIDGQESLTGRFAKNLDRKETQLELRLPNRLEAGRHSPS